MSRQIGSSLVQLVQLVNKDNLKTFMLSGQTTLILQLIAKFQLGVSGVNALRVAGLDGSQ